ncbi:ClpP/crotonase-like domain-containing protein [Chytriomyces sp. MP71]|nr:ClpP/crotonase-like domain-containing protein [Chytriomyces sp. MP71]
MRPPPFASTGGGRVRLQLRVPIAQQGRAKTCAVLTLDNGAKRNALSPRMMAELGDAVTAIREHLHSDVGDTCVAVVLTGAHGTFCSGFDLSSSADDALLNPGFAGEMSLLMHENMLALHSLPLVSIAAVDGFALGGGAELASWCDFRVMSAGAKAGFLQTKMGVVTGWGGATRLRHLMGTSRALRLLTSPRVLSAYEAYDLGFATHPSSISMPSLVHSTATSGVSHPPSHESVTASAIDIVHRDIFERDWKDAYPAALRAMKRTLCGDAGLEGYLEGLRKSLANERQEFVQLWGAQDNVEAVKNALTPSAKSNKKGSNL